MSPAIISKTLPRKILDSMIRKAVINAMKQEHSDITSVIKSIAAVTGIDANAIAKWYTGHHTPSTAHFLTLSMFYPGALQALLALIGRDDLWEIAICEQIPKRMQDRLCLLHAKYEKRGDIFGSGSLSQYSVALNKRQLWFLDELLKTGRLQNKDIATFWNVTLRTAKRDTEKLIAAGRMRSVREGGTGWFELTGETYDNA